MAWLDLQENLWSLQLSHSSSVASTNKQQSKHLVGLKNFQNRFCSTGVWSSQRRQEGCCEELKQIRKKERKKICSLPSLMQLCCFASAICLLLLWNRILIGEKHGIHKSLKYQNCLSMSILGNVWSRILQRAFDICFFSFPSQSQTAANLSLKKQGSVAKRRWLILEAALCLIFDYHTCYILA